MPLSKSKLRKEILEVFHENCDGTFGSDEPSKWSLELIPEVSGPNLVGDFIELLVDKLSKADI